MILSCWWRAEVGHGLGSLSCGGLCGGLCCQGAFVAIFGMFHIVCERFAFVPFASAMPSKALGAWRISRGTRCRRARGRILTGFSRGQTHGHRVCTRRIAVVVVCDAQQSHVQVVSSEMTGV